MTADRRRTAHAARFIPAACAIVVFSIVTSSIAWAGAALRDRIAAWMLRRVQR